MADLQEQDQDPLWGNLQETAAGQPEEWGNVADHYLPKAQPSPLQRAGRGEIPQDEAIRQYIQQTTSPQAVQQVINNVGDIATPVGNIHSAQDAVHAYNQGDWLGSALGAIGAIPVVGSIERAIPRSIDSLGYYSHALETAKALPQAKGTPEQMLAQLQKGAGKGAKSEIAASGLDKFLEGKKTVTQDEIVDYLTKNRVGLNETLRDSYPTFEALNAKSQELYGRPYSYNVDLPEEHRRAILEAISPGYLNRERTRWSVHSLDPRNPSYQEHTLSLPAPAEPYEVFNSSTGHILSRHNSEQEAASKAAELRASDPQRNLHVDYDNYKPLFQSEHFSEPNIVGHYQSSIVTDQSGRKLFNLDQVQSDWGQRVRDAGSFYDRSRLARLQNDFTNEQAKFFSSPQGSQWLQNVNELSKRNGLQPASDYRQAYGNITRLLQAGGLTRLEASLLHDAMRDDPAASDLKRLYAEVGTLAQAPAGHPLVNTTDQWTTTTLRHAIRKAIESGADAISIPHGDTVLSYNPGKAEGMRSFYGSPTQQGILPKNLRNVLQKLDSDAPAPYRTEAVNTSQGVQSHADHPRKYPFDRTQTGFTVFPLTDKIKQSIMQEGQPLFKRGGTVHRADGGETVVPKNTTATPQYDTAIPSLSDIFAQSTAPQPLSTWDKLRALFSDQPTGYQGMRPSTNIEDRRFDPPPYGNETRPFKTTVVPSRQHGGAISEGTHAMLAKLRKH